MTLPANNDILLQFPYTKLTCVRILPLVNVLVILGDELLAVILADVNTNLYLPTPESKLQLISIKSVAERQRESVPKRG